MTTDLTDGPEGEIIRDPEQLRPVEPVGFPHPPAAPRPPINNSPGTVGATAGTVGASPGTLGTGLMGRSPTEDPDGGPPQQNSTGQARR
jgi:hypothetical protein